MNPSLVLRRYIYSKINKMFHFSHFLSCNTVTLNTFTLLCYHHTIHPQNFLRQTVHVSNSSFRTAGLDFQMETGGRECGFEVSVELCLFCGMIDDLSL